MLKSGAALKLAQIIARTPSLVLSDSQRLLPGFNDVIHAVA